jgi:hypothetical protein
MLLSCENYLYLILYHRGFLLALLYFTPGSTGSTSSLNDLELKVEGGVLSLSLFFLRYKSVTRLQAGLIHSQGVLLNNGWMEGRTNSMIPRKNEACMIKPLIQVGKHSS